MKIDDAFKIAMEQAQKASMSSPEAQNLWKVENTPENCWEFIKRLKTWDEASECEAHFPDEEYLKKIVFDWYECRADGRRMIIEKSRRLLVSYLMCAIELFQIGHRRMNHLVMHLDLEKAEKEVWRIYQLYNYYRTHLDPRLPELKPSVNYHGNADAQKLERLMFPNGSIVTRHYQKGGNARGSGFSSIRIEELSAYDYPSGTWGQAKILTQGKPDENILGGFSYAICNSSPNPDWLSIKHGTRARDILDEKTPMVSKVLPDGTYYLVVHYTANSQMTEEWAAENLKDIPAGERRREYELYDDVHSGRPVYPMYASYKHWPSSLREGPVGYEEGSLIIVGLDAGITINGAGVILQLTPAGQFVYSREVASSEPLNSWDLIAALDAELRDLTGGLARTAYWVGDETVRNRSGNSRETVIQIAQREFGIKLIPVSNQLKPRLDSVARVLSEEIAEGVPMAVIDGYSCGHLRKGFEGAYRYRERLSDTGSRIISEPVKDEFSHVQDAAQYATIFALKLRSRMIVSATEAHEPEGRYSNAIHLGELIGRGGARRPHRRR